jgi:hypothetical protein
MKIMKLKTNVETPEMLKDMMPYLDNEQLISKWRCDTDARENILNVSGEEITPDVVTKAINKAGYYAELIRVIAVGGHDL